MVCLLQGLSSVCRPGPQRKLYLFAVAQELVNQVHEQGHGVLLVLPCALTHRLCHRLHHLVSGSVAAWQHTRLLGHLLPHSTGHFLC